MSFCHLTSAESFPFFSFFCGFCFCFGVLLFHKDVFLKLYRLCACFWLVSWFCFLCKPKTPTFLSLFLVHGSSFSILLFQYPSFKNLHYFSWLSCQTSIFAFLTPSPFKPDCFCLILSCHCFVLVASFMFSFWNTPFWSNLRCAIWCFCKNLCFHQCRKLVIVSCSFWAFSNVITMQIVFYAKRGSISNSSVLAQFNGWVLALFWSIIFRQDFGQEPDD